tara:strand:+ start:439 stop:798 length:360 start_codon:yes stop_codon:yes gene_type:complete
MTDFVINNVIRSQIVEDYLDFFENKDIEGISDLFSEECLLTDWNVGTIEGKQGVLDLFSEIFNSIDNIEVNITHIHEDITGTLVCEMALLLDEEKLLVVDVFDFNEEDQIKALRAYKGN